MKLIRDRVQITVSDDLNGKLSGERDLRILYVYEGKAILRLDGTEVAHKRDDFYVTGSGDTAEYRMEQAGFVGIIRIRYAFAEEYLDLRRYDILCSSSERRRSFKRKAQHQTDCLYENRLYPRSA